MICCLWFATLLLCLLLALSFVCCYVYVVVFERLVFACLLVLCLFVLLWVFCAFGITGLVVWLLLFGSLRVYWCLLWYFMVGLAVCCFGLCLVILAFGSFALLAYFGGCVGLLFTF